MKFNYYCVIAFLMFAFSYGQNSLPDFTIDVKVTDETCLGNGALAITASNTVPDATLTYLTYKLPDTTTPVSSSPTVNALSAGKYRVVVTQTSGTASNTQQKDVEILDKVVDLDYNITSNSSSGCGVTGTIIVNVTQGNPEFYEIIMGPKTFPKQSSNTFPGLPAGKYRVRVFDKCGEAVVRDYTLVVSQSNLTIGGTITPEKLINCTTVDVTNTLTPIAGTGIAYPLHVVYTIHPPNGAPDKTIVQDIPSGPTDLLTLKQTIDLYGNSDFTYDIKVTDSCGKDFILNGNNVGPFPKVVLTDSLGKCGGKFLTVDVTNFYPTYTIVFTQSPVGFDPKTFNSAHPGPFSNKTTIYGNDIKPVPFGTYEIEITDSCGRKVKAQHEIIESPMNPVTTAYNAGCDSKFGAIEIKMPDKSKIVSAKITKAPAEYQASLPSDVSSFINVSGIFFIQDIPVGKYDFVIADECGRQHIIQDLEVPVFVKQGMAGDSLPNCVIGSGSVKVLSGNGELKSIQITKAPSNLGKPLPYDVSFNLSGGQLLMSDLPSGDYEFKGIDACDYELFFSMTVIGYDRSEPSFSVERNCGSFNITIADKSNGVYNQTYWLQKFNPSTNGWEEPFTGAVYTEGAVPNITNSIPLTNNTTTYNLAVTGNFRVIKTFQSYADGGKPSMYKDCVEILGEFEYTNQLKIVGAYSLDCKGGAGAMSVVIDVLGVPPFTYKITEKDDAPFLVDNGSNNVFSGLIPATYNFQVEDNCGGLKNAKYNVATLPKLVVANAPGSMLLCTDADVQYATFDLTKQNAAIIGNQDPNNYKTTYYLNSADADSGINPIANPNFFVNTTNPQTIYARLIHTSIALCYDTTSFDILVGKTPVLSVAQTTFLCDGESKVLSADPGYDAYLWSTGATTTSIEVSAPGIYTVTVKDFYGNMSCDTSKDNTVEASGLANFDKIEVNDWADTSNSITVTVSGSGVYEYSLDNVNFQSENVFTDLKPGAYIVYVRDKNGCGTVQADVAVLSFPKFFTPNGDGVNDKWKINFSDLEPGIKVYVFDRFGKLIAGLDSANSGWDGTYNGEMMPSTDYWFTVERVDGRVHKGHFAMKR